MPHFYHFTPTSREEKLVMGKKEKTGDSENSVIIFNMGHRGKKFLHLIKKYNMTINRYAGDILRAANYFGRDLREDFVNQHDTYEGDDLAELDFRLREVIKKIGEMIEGCRNMISFLAISDKRVKDFKKDAKGIMDGLKRIHNDFFFERKQFYQYMLMNIGGDFPVEDIVRKCILMEQIYSNTN